MKRIILAIGILFVTLTCSANTAENDSIRYLASTLGQNWFVTANGSINWWQGSDRNPIGNYTTLNGPTFGGGVSVGKWITHNLALRVSYDINRSHSYLDGLHLNRPDCQFLFKDNPAPDANGYYPTTFMYHNLHGEVLLSVIDFINGYYDDRFYTPVITLGMGVACISEHTFVTQTFIEDGFKHNRNFEPSANIGLINNFKMNKNFDLVFTAMMTGTRFSIDSWGYELDDETIGVRSRVVDFNYSMSLGLTWNISGSDEYGSRIYELPHNYSNEMREMRERIRNLENELDDCLRYRPTDTVYQIINTTDTVQEIVSFPFSVFFHIDSYQLMSKRDLVNLREIAKVAMEKGWKIRLRGSCDSATATPEYNQRLSENRCNKIKLELMDMGVPESQFILVPVGGVKELDPTEYDRRVLIELVKELK
jgi:outer membrane protein OmpA-like peptidoglycan-associated protein